MAHEIYIYDVIGRDFFGEGITAEYVRGELDKAKGKPVTVRINSPGGDVWEGQAIYNLLAAHGVDVEIDSLAASIASVIAMAGKKIRIAENASFMVHEAWTRGAGHKRDWAKTIERLAAVDAMIAKTYATRSGGKRDETTFLANMEAETWFTAEQAVEAGLADEIGQKLKVKAALRNEMLAKDGGKPLSIAACFNNTPATLFADPSEGSEPNAAQLAAVQALDLRLRIERKHENAVEQTPALNDLRKRLTQIKECA